MCNTDGHWGAAGNDKKRKRDNELKHMAWDQLDEMKIQYDRQTGDSGYFSKQIDTLTDDATHQTSQAEENLALTKSQSTSTMNTAFTMGTQKYQTAVKDSRASIEESIKKSQLQAVTARDNTAVDIYGMMEKEGMSGVAGIGDRARRILTKKKASSTDAIALGLKQSKESTDRNLANAEIAMNQERTSGAQSSQNAIDTAELTMNQTRANVERKLQTDVDAIHEQKAKALDNMVNQGMDARSDTIRNFEEKRYSNWNGAGDSGSEGWTGNQAETDSGDNTWHTTSIGSDFREKFKGGS